MGLACCHVERRHGGSEEKALLCVAIVGQASGT
jgi:hypothetical protein